MVKGALDTLGMEAQQGQSNAVESARVYAVLEFVVDSGRAGFRASEQIAPLNVHKTARNLKWTKQALWFQPHPTGVVEDTVEYRPV